MCNYNTIYIYIMCVCVTRYLAQVLPKPSSIVRILQQKKPRDLPNVWPFFVSVYDRILRVGRRENQIYSHTGPLRIPALRWLMHSFLGIDTKFMWAFVKLLQWLKDDFLGYLAEWNKSVSGRAGFTAAQKQQMLSRETVEGLTMTGTRSSVS